MASSSRLKPTEKGSINIKVFIADKEGTVVKTVEVSSNDPKRPKVTLLLKAILKRPPPEPEPQSSQPPPQ